MIFNTNSPLPITVTNLSNRKFFRMTPYIIANPAAEICINHLRQITIAKFLWQRDHNTSTIANPLGTAIQPYFPHHLLPFCPRDVDQTLDTSYNLGDLQTSPICIIIPTTHYLEEAR